MSWITTILTGGTNKLVGSIGKIIDNVHTSDEEKKAALLEMEKLLLERDREIESTIRTELTAKERVLVAELQQGDAYTKRARPTVVYAGLFFIAYNYAIAPSVGIGRLDLPTEFWLAWGGIVSTWVIGRSAEKRGARSNTLSLITGSKLAGE
jgi:hypothetical protein